MNGNEMMEILKAMSEDERKGVLIPGFWDIDGVDRVIAEILDGLLPANATEENYQRLESITHEEKCSLLAEAGRDFNNAETDDDTLEDLIRAGLVSYAMR